MKILIYGINFAPELTGIGKYTGDMALFLAQRGHRVRVVTAPPYYPEWRIWPGYSGGRYQRETWEGVKVVRCPLYVPRRVSGVKRLAHLSTFGLSSLPQVLAQAAWKPDLIFSVAPSIFSAPAAALAGRLAGCKVWLHVQDFELDAAFNLGIVQGGSAAYRLAAGVEHSILRAFDCVSTISNRMVARLVQKGVDPEKACLFPNWADTEHIYPQPGPSRLRQELRLDPRQRIVLYSGNMGRKQGVEILVELARRLQDLPDVRLVLCGEGVARQELVRRAEGLPNVTFLPLQPLDRLNDLLNMADVHVLPQRADAADLVMPSKLTGMLASGRPVVATAAAGTELYEVVRQVGVAVPPEDVDALADAVRSLLRDPQRMAGLGRAGRQFVEQNWSRQHVLQKFIDNAQRLTGAPVVGGFVL